MKQENSFLLNTWLVDAFILISITIALWSAYNLLQTGEKRTQPKVSVLVEDSSSERWTSFRLGLDQAAAEYGADVTYITSTGFSSAEEQKGLISQEAAAGTNAMILSLYDSEATESVPDTMKIVFVETDGIRDSGEGMAAVIPSGRKMGEALGEMMLEGSKTNPSVAILAGNLHRYSEKEMLEGLTETIESAGGSTTVFQTSDEDLASVMFQAEKSDLIAVLEDPLLVQAAGIAVSENLGSGVLYGIGCSPSNISYLERGVISGMVVPNEFSMGYQSLAQLSRFISNDLPAMKDIEIGFTCVRTAEVHDPENEKLLFPEIR